MKQRAEVFANKVVRIEIKGHERAPTRAFAIQARDDDDLVGDFMEWCRENNVHPVHLSGCGAGSYVAYFEPDDALKASRWLMEAMEIPETPEEIQKKYPWACWADCVMAHQDPELRTIPEDLGTTERCVKEGGCMCGADKREPVTVEPWQKTVTDWIDRECGQ